MTPPRRIFVTALFAAAAAVFAAAATVGAPAGNRTIVASRLASAQRALEAACGNTTPIVDVNWTIYNTVDTDASGNRAWAVDPTATQRMRIWQTGPNAFCEVRQIQGTFSSIAGVSPAGTGTISAGVTGTFSSIDTQTFGGTFDPGSRPTQGTLANFDDACRIDPNDPTKWRCAGSAGTYFPAGRSNRVFPASGFFLYDGGAHGRWLELGTRSLGDIVG
jgi:hypothetical protein